MRGVSASTGRATRDKGVAGSAGQGEANGDKGNHQLRADTTAGWCDGRGAEARPGRMFGQGTAHLWTPAFSSVRGGITKL